MLLFCRIACAAQPDETGVPLVDAQSPVIAQSNSPNVVTVLIDDMEYSDLSSFGGAVATTNIDRLTDEGIRFTNSYGNSPIW